MSEQRPEYIAKLDSDATPTATNLPMALVLADRNERQSKLLGQEPEYAIELRRQYAFIQEMKYIFRTAETAFLFYAAQSGRDIEKMKKNIALADKMQATITKIDSGVYE